jgi:hypothetical protein
VTSLEDVDQLEHPRLHQRANLLLSVREASVEVFQQVSHPGLLGKIAECVSVRQVRYPDEATQNFARNGRVVKEPFRMSWCADCGADGGEGTPVCAKVATGEAVMLPDSRSEVPAHDIAVLAHVVALWSAGISDAHDADVQFPLLCRAEW